jgi:DNA repair protein RadA/Sms
VEDPACDLAVAVALASAATGALPPPGSAFIGELSLTGLVRPAPALEQRLLAARAAGCRTVFVPEERARPPEGLRVVTVRDLVDVLGRALSPAEIEPVRLPA